jgi:hypothetical protein
MLRWARTLDFPPSKLSAMLGVAVIVFSCTIGVALVSHPKLTSNLVQRAHLTHTSDSHKSGAPTHISQSVLSDSTSTMTQSSASSKPVSISAKAPNATTSQTPRITHNTTASSENGTLILSETDVSVKLGKSAPDLLIHASNGDPIIENGSATITDSLSPSVFVAGLNGNPYSSTTQSLMVNAGAPTTKIGAHEVTITVKGKHGIYSGTMTVHVLPPPAYTLSIWRQWQDSPFGYIELTATGDLDYDVGELTSLSALTLINVPPEFDCKYNNEYDYETENSSTNLLIHWRCMNVGSAPPAVYTITFRFEDQFGTIREIPVTFNDLGY